MKYLFTGDEKIRWNVVIEYEEINDGTEDFFIALQECYACFYNFNMQYPRDFSCTLEFIQRYFMKCHPDGGTKSQTFNLSKKKVLSLLKNISEFEMVKPTYTFN